MRMNVTFKEQNEVLKANFGEVVEVGGGSEQDNTAFWDLYQDKGNREDYSTAFGGVGWNNETFKPKYNINATNAYMMFRNTGIEGDLVELLDKFGVELSTENSINTSYVYNSATKLTRIGKLDVRKSQNSIQTDSVFTNCTALKTIDEIVVDENTKYAAGTFRNCTVLEYVGFTGNIGNTLYLQFSPLLTAECVKNILLQLVDYSGTDKNLTNSVSFHSSVWDMLNAEGNTAPGGVSWADYVYNKGWNK